MKIPDWLPVYGDLKYRGECPKEDTELMTFFNELKRLYPHLAAIAIHPNNEGLVQGSGFVYHSRQKAKGAIKKGASDIIIMGNPTFVCELKKKNHVKSYWEDGQQEFLEASKNNGAFVCVAFGYEAALEAVKVWASKA